MSSAFDYQYYGGLSGSSQRGPWDNIIGGERYPDGYTPMPIKNSKWGQSTDFAYISENHALTPFFFNHEAWPMETGKAWDTAPRGEPATGLMTDWLKKGALESMIPPPTQPID